MNSDSPDFIRFGWHDNRAGLGDKRAGRYFHQVGIQSKVRGGKELQSDVAVSAGPFIEPDNKVAAVLGLFECRKWLKFRLRRKVLRLSVIPCLDPL
jgi:hypothetical protein